MIGHAGAALALILAQTAQPTPPPRQCLTPEEAGAGAAVMLPELVDTVGRSCARHLSETVFLRTNGTELAQRWRSESAGHRQVAMVGLTRMLPPPAMEGMAQGMQVAQRARETGDTRSGPLQAAPPSASPGPPPSPLAMLPQIMTGLEAVVTARMTPQTCKEASRLIESLAPLSAANIARLVSATMAMGVALSPPKGDDGPPICRT